MKYDAPTNTPTDAAQKEQAMDDFRSIPNDRLAQEIDRWIKSARDRQLLRRRLIDGRTYDELSDEFYLSRRQVARIIARAKATLKNE